MAQPTLSLQSYNDYWAGLGPPYDSEKGKKFQIAPSDPISTWLVSVNLDQGCQTSKNSTLILWLD